MSKQDFMTVRRGDWMQTFTNKAFWPLDPCASEVDIEDIAHSLAQQCRYAGHCKTFYSVAEHSVRVAHLLEAFSVEVQFAGLLHDAAEAYVVDLPRPVKRFMPEYAPIEDAVAKAIWEKFNVGVACDDPRIKTADEILLATEKRDLMGPPPRDWGLRESPMIDILTPLSSAAAKQWFLSRFEKLNREREIRR